MIVPTPGRIVWFHDKQADEAKAAIVVKVWGDRMVNLTVFDYGGTTRAETSVTLVQEGDTVPPSRYAEWMPYQIGQAKKS